MVDPWTSSDIGRGSRWDPEIAAKLEESKVGIICLTKENLNAPWLLFEAGAISKTKDVHVCTLLVGITSSEVEQPLGQFQHTSSSRAEVLELLKTISDAVKRGGEKPLSDDTLVETFESSWPR